MSRVASSRQSPVASRRFPFVNVAVLVNVAVAVDVLVLVHVLVDVYGFSSGLRRDYAD